MTAAEWRELETALRREGLDRANCNDRPFVQIV
jgi:hypothetical protein